jgi:hypothetical protein
MREQQSSSFSSSWLRLASLTRAGPTEKASSTGRSTSSVHRKTQKDVVRACVGARGVATTREWIASARECKNPSAAGLQWRCERGCR